MNSNKSKKTAINNCMLPCINCSICGTKIVLVPDPKFMGNAIEDHVEEHMRKVKDPTEAEAEAEHIYVDLISQVFDKASKT